jgi:hypothetical protein
MNALVRLTALMQRTSALSKSGIRGASAQFSTLGSAEFFEYAKVRRVLAK